MSREPASAAHGNCLGIVDTPPAGFRRMKCLNHPVDGCDIWAKGSMFSPSFTWCYVRERKD